MTEPSNHDHLAATIEALQAWAHINSLTYIQQHGIPQAFTDYFYGTWPNLTAYTRHQTEQQKPTAEREENIGEPDEEEAQLHTQLAQHYHLIHSPAGWHIFHKTN